MGKTHLAEVPDRCTAGAHRGKSRWTAKPSLGTKNATARRGRYGVCAPRTDDFPLPDASKKTSWPEWKACRTKPFPKFVYDTFPVLQEMRNRKGGNLSGGQQQQLAISRALVTQSESHLSWMSQLRVFSLLS